MIRASYFHLSFLSPFGAVGFKETCPSKISVRLTSRRGYQSTGNLAHQENQGEFCSTISGSFGKPEILPRPPSARRHRHSADEERGLRCAHIRGQDGLVRQLQWETVALRHRQERKGPVHNRRKTRIRQHRGADRILHGVQRETRKASPATQTHPQTAVADGTRPNQPDTESGRR